VTQEYSPGKKNPENVQVGFPEVLMKKLSLTKHEIKSKERILKESLLDKF